MFMNCTQKALLMHLYSLITESECDFLSKVNRLCPQRSNLVLTNDFKYTRKP